MDYHTTDVFQFCRIKSNTSCGTLDYTMELEWNPKEIAKQEIFLYNFICQLKEKSPLDVAKSQPFIKQKNRIDKKS